jgi:hypothetical protein
VLKIDRDAVLNKLTALTGGQPRGDLKFEPVADFRTPKSTYLRRLFMLLVDLLSSSERSVPPLALAELEHPHCAVPVCQPTQRKSFA